eukprot:2842020-Pleurochrysis_carterae.AAC.5
MQCKRRRHCHRAGHQARVAHRQVRPCRHVASPSYLRLPSPSINIALASPFLPTHSHPPSLFPPFLALHALPPATLLRSSLPVNLNHFAWRPSCFPLPASCPLQSLVCKDSPLVRGCSSRFAVCRAAEFGVDQRIVETLDAT